MINLIYLRKVVLSNKQRTLHSFFKQSCINGYCNIFTNSILTKNHYEILGVNRNANNKQIKDAYLYLSKIYHPDKVIDNEVSSEKYIQIREAYDVLSDDIKRTGYDKEQFQEFENSSKSFKRKTKKHKEEELTEEEKQNIKNEKDAMENMRGSPIYKLLGYLYAFIMLSGGLMWWLSKKLRSNNENDDDS